MEPTDALYSADLNLAEGIEDAFERSSDVHRRRRLRGNNPRDQCRDNGNWARGFRCQAHPYRSAPAVDAAVLRQSAARRAYSRCDRARDHHVPHRAGTGSGLGRHRVAAGRHHTAQRGSKLLSPFVGIRLLGRHVAAGSGDGYCRGSGRRMRPDAAARFPDRHSPTRCDGKVPAPARGGRASGGRGARNHRQSRWQRTVSSRRQSKP